MSGRDPRQHGGGRAAPAHKQIPGTHFCGCTFNLLTSAYRHMLTQQRVLSARVERLPVERTLAAHPARRPIHAVSSGLCFWASRTCTRLRGSVLSSPLQAAGFLPPLTQPLNHHQPTPRAHGAWSGHTPGPHLGTASLSLPPLLELLQFLRPVLPLPGTHPVPSGPG